MAGQHLRRLPMLSLVALLLLGTASAALAAPSGPVDAPHRLLLPLVNGPVLSYRLGYGVHKTIEGYAGVDTLQAGWYVDWAVRTAPLRPGGTEYVQTVHVHQKLTCPLHSANAHDRTLCPYAQPYDYLSTDKAAISEAAAANKGSLWLIGNEMDRRDWPGGGQDEILPETYAVAYHDLSAYIKSLDPSARIAIGGVIQPTPLRLEYLTKAWDAYQQRYGVPMPVDVWNVHNFILREKLGSYGASVPPGSSSDTGVLYPPEVGGDSTHVSMVLFDQQIRAFRQWMKDRGQQDKPLIISEYGVLYSHIPEVQTAVDVQDFMVRTFDYFLATRDCALGQPADGCRLVQRWAWFSLNDPSAETGFNQYGPLYDFNTQQITSTGERFRQYSLTNIWRLQK